MVVVMVGSYLFVISKTRKIPQNDKTRTYIFVGVVILIFGVLNACLDLALSETPWNEFRDMFYKTLLFRKIRLPNIPEWKNGADYLNMAYALAVAGLMLVIVGILKGILRAIFIGDTERYYTENELTISEEGKVSGKISIFKDKLQTKHIIFIVILVIAMIAVPGLIIYLLGHTLPYYAVSGLILLFFIILAIIEKAILPSKAGHIFIKDTLKNPAIEDTRQKPKEKDILDQINDFQKNLFTKDLNLTIKDIVQLVLIAIVIIVVIYMIASQL